MVCDLRHTFVRYPGSKDAARLDLLRVTGLQSVTRADGSWQP